MRERRGECRIYCGKPRTERDYLEELGIDGKILLKLVVTKWVGSDWTDVSQDRDK
jgi:hypothetical protein